MRNQRREASQTSLGKITEHSANREIEITSVVYSPKKISIQSNLRNNFQQQSAISPFKTPIANRDKNQQLQYKNNSIQKTNPSKAFDFTPHSASSSSNSLINTSQQQDSVNRFSKKQGRARTNTINHVNPEINLTKSAKNPKKEKNSNISISAVRLGTLLDRKLQQKATQSQVGVKPQTLIQQKIKSQSLYIKNNKKSHQTVGQKVAKNNVGRTQRHKEETSAHAVTPEIAKDVPFPLSYPILDGKETQEAYFSNKASTKQLITPELTAAAQQHYEQSYSPSYSPNRNNQSLQYSPTNSQERKSFKAILTLSEFKKDVSSARFNGENEYNRRGARTKMHDVTSNKDRTASFQIMSTNGNLSTDSRAERLLQENFKLKKELFNLKKQIYIDDKSDATPVLNSDVQEVLQDQEETKDKNEFNRSKSIQQSSQNAQEISKPVLRESYSSNPFIQWAQTPSPINSISHNRVPSSLTGKKSVCTHTQSTRQGPHKRVNTMLSVECKECCCQNFVTKNSKSRHSGVYSMMSDASMPSFALIDTDRSKAPCNQIQKLKRQKDNPLPNNPEQVGELKNTQNSYSYDKTLKNLQKSLLNANEHDKDIRKRLEEEESITYIDDTGLDELAPVDIKINANYSTGKTQKQFSGKRFGKNTEQVRHNPQIGPFNKTDKTQKAMQVMMSYSHENIDKESEEDSYSVNDVSIDDLDKEATGSVRFSTQQRRKRKDRSHKKNQNSQNSTSLQDSNKDLYTPQQKLPFGLEVSEIEKQSPESPIFAKDEALDMHSSDYDTGGSNNTLIQEKVYKQFQKQQISARSDVLESPTEPTPDMPDEIDYQYLPIKQPIVLDLEKHLQGIGIAKTMKSSKNAPKTLPEMNSCHSSRNTFRNLDEFGHVSDYEDTCRQTVRVGVTSNNMQSEKTKGRLSRTMRQEKKAKETKEKQSTLAYKLYPTKGKKLARQNRNNRNQFKTASNAITETQHTIPSEWVPLSTGDIEYSPGKFSQVNIVDEEALQLKVREALSHSMRVTSADRVKISSPIHTKTKTYLDTFSQRFSATNSAASFQAPSFQAQSSRREKNMSNTSIRTYGSLLKSKKKQNIANKDVISLGWQNF